MGHIRRVLQAVDRAVEALGHLAEREGAALNGRSEEERRLRARLLQDGDTGVGDEWKGEPWLWGHPKLL